LSSVQIVLAAFGEAHVAGARAALTTLVGRLFPGAQVRGLVVDNARSAGAKPDGDWLVIGGDNRCREFSAWDAGLRRLDPGDSVILLANDTLHRSYGTQYLDGFTPERLRDALARGGLLGWIDAYPRPVELFGCRVQRWVRTSLLIAHRRVIESLRPMALGFSDDEIFSADELFRAPSPLSENYRRYLRTWLFGEHSDDEFHERWHSAAPLTAQNAAAVRGKIRSILCEHHLSARAARLGIPLIDVR
jgi:hypothetical protein